MTATEALTIILLAVMVLLHCSAADVRWKSYSRWAVRELHYELSLGKSFGLSDVKRNYFISSISAL